MNVLSMVFSLILILTYGFYANWSKQYSAQRLRSGYLHNEKAARQMHNTYQSEVYKRLQGKSLAKEKPQKKKKKKKIAKPRIASHCSKLNLYPLFQEGKAVHPHLYELSVKLFSSFYENLGVDKKLAKLLLDQLAEDAKSGVPLEKLEMKGRRELYYKMLRGTKKPSVVLNKGYVPLLDYVKAEPGESKLCLFHASPDFLGACFGRHLGHLLYEEIHKEDAPLLTRELLDAFCKKHRAKGLKPELLELFEFGNPEHKEEKKTLLAKEGFSSLKQTVTFH